MARISKSGLSAEDIFRYELGKAKIPSPSKEFKFHPKRRWRADMAWPEARLIVEVEGGVWTGGRHTRGKGFLGDVEKYNAMTELGWALLRYTPTQLSSADVISQFIRVYEARFALMEALRSEGLDKQFGLA